MKSCLLKVDGSLDGELTFELERRSGKPLHAASKSNVTAAGLKYDPSLLTKLLPPTIISGLNQWVVEDSTPGILAVVSLNSALDAIPWEYIPLVLKVSTLYVVRLDSKEADEQSPERISRILAVGWSGKPTFNLPGIQEELQAIEKLNATDGLQVQVLFEPDVKELADACESFLPNIVHIIPVALDTTKAPVEVTFSQYGKIFTSPIDEFLSNLPSDPKPRLVVLSTCAGGEGHGGPSAIRMLGEHFHTVIIGWHGEVTDVAAVDFARFLYARILEGETIMEVLSDYRLGQPTMNNVEALSRNVRVVSSDSPLRFGPVPMVWTPAVDLLEQPLWTPPAMAMARALAPMVRDEVSSADSTPDVKIEFAPEPWLNPALLKNNWSPIKSLAVTPDRELHKVSIAISCDTGSRVSTVRQTFSLKKGYQLLDAVKDWQFPMLYELIAEARPRQQINFSISCSVAGQVIAEIAAPVLWMGCTEWLDRQETWCFLPAFVNPYADAVLDVITRAYAVLKMIGNPRDDFKGYQMRDVNFVDRQVEAVFKCLNNDFLLQYIGPPPILVYVPDGKSKRSTARASSGQRVRTPDEVIGRRRGTCHDLVLLFASCLEQIQIYPLIVLIDQHTFVGYWRDQTEQNDFWEKASKKRLRLPNTLGREWMIIDKEELQRLVRDELITLVEATMLTDRNATFKQASDAGYDLLFGEINSERRFDAAIDIQASRVRVQPI